MAYFERGVLCYDLMMYKNALYNFSKVIEMNQTDFLAYYYRGMIKYDLKDLRGACFGSWARLDWSRCSSNWIGRSVGRIEGCDCICRE